MSDCGQIIGGRVGKILIREKSSEKIELGDLLVAEDKEGYLLIKVYDLYSGTMFSLKVRQFFVFQEISTYQKYFLISLGW